MEVAVLGGGGFIGGHLVRRLIQERVDEIQVVDIKPRSEWHQLHNGGGSGARVSNWEADLRSYDRTLALLRGVDEVYLLAADMGGMGFLASNRVACLHTVDVTSTVMRACSEAGVGRVFYASSACVYNDSLQGEADVPALKEPDAWPANPEPAYGLEKLYGEEFCRWYSEEKGLETRVARFHNIFGEMGSYNGGREKAPAAVCRKVAEAALTGVHEIDIWGDGEQTRSFLHVEECLEGVSRLMRSDVSRPLNIGSDELVSINQLVTMVEEIAGVRLERTYDLTKPQGVRGRNSDNTLIQELLGWAPSSKLADGLESTYRWVHDQVRRQHR